MYREFSGITRMDHVRLCTEWVETKKAKVISLGFELTKT